LVSTSSSSSRLIDGPKKTRFSPASGAAKKSTISNSAARQRRQAAEYLAHRFADKRRPRNYRWRLQGARDITDRLRAEEERRRLLASEKEARQQAEDASRLKDEFLAVVSHELRNPLNAITGWASLLRTGKLNNEQTARAVETILRNAQVQTQLIQDLLDVSAIVSGRLRLNVRPFQLSSIVEAAIEVMRPAAEAKSVRMQPSIDFTAGPVTGDPDRLQQVFWNLLSNAVKFTPNGGRVQIRLQGADSHVEFVVTDTGSGIDPKLLPFVFERFRQGDSSTTREYGGLGLGLAIVRHLIELHGGVVKAHSEGLGKGAEFIVRLPILAAGRSAGTADERRASKRRRNRCRPDTFAGRLAHPCGG
jgi:signal transduction histidine kinase